MGRVIGIDTHRTFGEVVIWDAGRLRHVGRIDMTRTALEGFGKELLATDEVVIEATANCMAVSRVLTPFVKRVVIANPLQVKAIAHSQAKTDKIDAGTLANLYAAGYLPEIGHWTREPSGCVGFRPPLSSRAASDADQERGPRYLVRLPDPALSACRFIQPRRPGLALNSLPDDERSQSSATCANSTGWRDLALDKEIAGSALTDPASSD
jgi:hypothetical protein